VIIEGFVLLPIEGSDSR